MQAPYEVCLRAFALAANNVKSSSSSSTGCLQVPFAPMMNQHLSDSLMDKKNTTKLMPSVACNENACNTSWLHAANSNKSNSLNLKHILHLHRSFSFFFDWFKFGFCSRHSSKSHSFVNPSSIECIKKPVRVIKNNTIDNIANESLKRQEESHL